LLDVSRGQLRDGAAQGVRGLNYCLDGLGESRQPLANQV
jgi:hypothetical protein